MSWASWRQKNLLKKLREERRKLQKLLLKRNGFTKKWADSKKTVLLFLIHKIKTMAKRKTKKHITRRRSRRVSGILPGKNEILDVVGVVAGVVGASYVSGLLPASLDEKIKSVIVVAGGLVLMKQKNGVLSNAGKGLAAVGAFKLVNALRPGTLPAIGTVQPIVFDNPKLLSGFNSYPNNPQRNTIAGFNSYPNNPQRNTIAGVRSAVSSGAGL